MRGLPPCRQGRCATVDRADTFSTSFMSFLRRMAPIMELMGSAMPGDEGHTAAK